MYSVSVRDHVMIAHSLKGEVFGPARRLHGATYVIDAEFRRATLDADGLVIDIGQATALLRAALAGLDYRNLDDEPDFAGRNTTTEMLAGEIFERIAGGLRAAGLDPAAGGPESLKVTLQESHVARASFEAPLPDAPGGA